MKLLNLSFFNMATVNLESYPAVSDTAKPKFLFSQYFIIFLKTSRLHLWYLFWIVFNFCFFLYFHGSKV